MTTSTRLPEASLLEEWTVARTQHWARTSGAFVAAGGVYASMAAATAPGSSRPVFTAAESGTRADVVDAERASRRADHLLRLAGDERATAHERALAAERAARLLRRFAS